jgi:signal-transduction protein with cAMP-binding, CBS, and nucleotidyltransferase domain
MPIFEDSPREFYTEICLAIKTNVFSVRELVIREGEVNNYMHIIERGLVVCRGKFVTKCVASSPTAPHND